MSNKQFKKAATKAASISSGKQKYLLHEIEKLAIHGDEFTHLSVGSTDSAIRTTEEEVLGVFEEALIDLIPALTEVPEEGKTPKVRHWLNGAYYKKTENEDGKPCLKDADGRIYYPVTDNFQKLLASNEIREYEPLGTAISNIAKPAETSQSYHILG